MVAVMITSGGQAGRDQHIVIVARARLVRRLERMHGPMGADAARRPTGRRGAAAVAAVTRHRGGAAVAVCRIGRHRFRVVEAGDFRLLALAVAGRRGGLAVEGAMRLLVIVVVGVRGVSVLAVQLTVGMVVLSAGRRHSRLIGDYTRAAVQFGGGIAVGRWCGMLLLLLCIEAVGTLGHRIGIAVHAVMEWDKYVG